MTEDRYSIFNESQRIEVIVSKLILTILYLTARRKRDRSVKENYASRS